MFDFKCPKCDSKEYSLSELRGSEGGIGAFFDLDNAIFTAVTCDKCKYTEFYNFGVAMFKHRFGID